MKKMPFVLMSILIFTAIVTFTSAKQDKPGRTEFSQFLIGTFAPATQSEYGLWVAWKAEFVTGTSEGNLPHGSLATFTIVSYRRFKTDDGKSFINGTWKFVSSDESTISGIFNGKGITQNAFYGNFVTNESEGNTKAYVKAKIQGEFECWIEPLLPYGNLWKYEAWWNGTYKEGGN
jgi:hypothetical protein